MTATELELPQYIILSVIPLGFILLFLEFTKNFIVNLIKEK
jgi:hypothetical protein